MSNDKLIEGIQHYQRNLSRGMRDGNNTKVMHCIFKLSNMPITTGHLEETGIGRTVNAMRKMDGEIGDAARTLVSKWKQMVSQNQDCDESTENTSTESTSKSDSSHSRSDKHRNTEKNAESDRSEESDSDSSSEDEEEEDVKLSPTSAKNSSGSEAEDEIEETCSKPKRSRHESPPPRRKNRDEKPRDRNGRHADDEEEKRSRETREKRDRKDEEKTRSKKDEDRRRDKSRDKDRDRSEKSRSSEKDRRHKDSRDEDEKFSKKTSSSSSSSKRKRERNDDDYDRPTHAKTPSKDKSSKNRSEETKRSTEKSKHDSKDSKKDAKVIKSSNDSKEQKSKTKSSSSSSSKLEVIENGISSECGTSFAEALGMLEPSTSKSAAKRSKTEKPVIKEKSPERDWKPQKVDDSRKDKDKKKAKETKEKPQKERERDRSPTKSRPVEIVIPPPPPAPLPKGEIDITSLLPPITPNYKPMSNPMLDFAQRTKVANEDETLSLVMYQKNQRTKVYSGNKCVWGSVPSLFEMCIRILQDNIDALEYTGGVPYAILKPVLDKASPEQLYMMEHYNAYLMEDTDEIWKFHCQKVFKAKKREELESWRDMYMRCLDEREAKLKALTENIKQSQDKSTPVRQTKLAYMDSIVKPPRDIARKQAKNGVEPKRPVVTPQQRLNSIAAGSSGAVSVPNPVRPVNTGSSGIKPKKAPLMQKTLALLKGGRFRR